MVRVEDSNGADTDTNPEGESSGYVRLAGNGLPGGEQQQASSSGVAAAPSVDSSPGRSVPLAIASSSSPANVANNQYAIPVDENGHRYVGLVNQASFI